MKIRTKISLAFSFLFTVIFLLLAVLTFSQLSSILRDQIFIRLHTVAESRRDHIDTYFDQLKGRMSDFASDGKIKDCLYDLENSCTSAELVEHLIVNKVPAVEGLYEVWTLDTEGKVVASSKTENIGLDQSREQVFELGKESPAVIDLFSKQNDDGYYLTVAAPIYREGLFVGVVASNIDANQLFSILEEDANLGETAETYLVNNEGYFVSPSLFLGPGAIQEEKVDSHNSRRCLEASEHVGHGHESILDPAHLGQEYVEEFEDYRGVKVLGTFAYVAKMDWCLLAEIDSEEAFAPVVSLQRFQLIFGAGVLLLTYLTSTALVTRFSKPLEKLQRGIERIEQGDLSVRVGSGKDDEIGMLSRAFDRMLSSLQQSRQSISRQVEEQTHQILQNAEDMQKQRLALLNVLEDVQQEKQVSEQVAQDLQKYQMAVESAADQILITTQDGIVLYANPAVAKISGYTIEEAMGKKCGALWGGFMDREFYKDLWDTVLIKKKPFYGEVRNRRKNGEMYEATINISPILDENGDVRFLVESSTDITRAKEIDRMKTEFISLASHQLRTPLSAMRWFLELLLNRDLGEIPPQQLETVENIYKSNSRMIELVDALLNISRIESGRLIIEPVLTDLRTLIQEVVTELTPRAEERRQHLVVTAAGDVPQISVDPKLIRQVYSNLISNAIKYSPEDSEIAVSLSQDNENVISQVTDHGYGIPKQDLHKVFDKFFRGDNIVKRETDGTGLGLYLTKVVVESSGGRIWFESEEGRGTTFWFSLPKSGTKPREGEVTLQE